MLRIVVMAVAFFDPFVLKKNAFRIAAACGLVALAVISALLVYPSLKHGWAMRYVLDSGGKVSFDLKESSKLTQKVFGMEAAARVTAINLGVDETDLENSGRPTVRPVTRDNLHSILKNLKTFPSLRSLDLHNLPVTDDDVWLLLTTEHPALRRVDLRGTNVSQDFLAEMRRSKRSIETVWSHTNNAFQLDQASFNRPPVHPVAYAYRKWGTVGIVCVVTILLSLVIVKWLGGD